MIRGIKSKLSLRAEPRLPVWDIRRELKPAERFLKRAAAAYARQQGSKAAGYPTFGTPISAAGIEFNWSGSPPELRANFDTRQIHDPQDGQWSHQAFANLPMRRMGAFLKACRPKGGFVIDAAGKRHRLHSGQTIDDVMIKWLRQALKLVIQAAQKQGAFDRVKKSDGFAISAEGFEPVFLWTSQRKAKKVKTPPAGPRQLKKGERYRSTKPFTCIVLTSYDQRGKMPAGEEFVVAEDSHPRAVSVFCKPVNYDKLHAKLVSAAERKNKYYKGYQILIPLAAIEDCCERLA